MRRRHIARLDDNTNLAEAYMRMYVREEHLDKIYPEIRQEQKEESESDTMSAAAAIQQATKQVEDEGGETSTELQKADQESEKYINDKISQFKKS